MSKSILSASIDDVFVVVSNVVDIFVVVEVVDAVVEMVVDVVVDVERLSCSFHLHPVKTLNGPTFVW